MNPFPRGTFPNVIDNSIRSQFTACEKKFEYGFIDNLSPSGTSVHLHAGGAFAHGMEAVRRAFYVDGRDETAAIAHGVTELLAYYGDYDCPPESAKSAERMAGALDFYFQSYRLGDDYVKPWTDGTSHGIEYSFSIPLPINHPDTGMPILYAGRFDMLGQHKNGSLFVVDEKTATSLGAQWSKQWELESQFTGYCFGARAFGQPVTGALIRGVSILKTKYDTAECIIYRPQWQIDRWYKQLLRDVRRMIEIYERAGDEANYQLDKGSCNSYGGCSFLTLCGSPDPERWVPIHYEPRVWHPMLREEREEELAAAKESRNG